uniref:Uncharacterized protein n=1 Tax=Corethron hystrix TaxID=216773 RepID=A0A7S1FX85_9STRA
MSCSYVKPLPQRSWCRGSPANVAGEPVMPSDLRNQARRTPPPATLGYCPPSSFAPLANASTIFPSGSCFFASTLTSLPLSSTSACVGTVLSPSSRTIRFPPSSTST